MARRARAGAAPEAAGAAPPFPAAASAFPYETDYNDHFETPPGAYEDILPLLDAVAPEPSRPSRRRRADVGAPTKGGDPDDDVDDDEVPLGGGGGSDPPPRSRHPSEGTEGRGGDRRRGNVVDSRQRGGGGGGPALESSVEPRDGHVLYDPYYCDGRTSVLLRSLGFSDVIHEKRDFYADIRNGTVPAHHTMVTNPPYSADHKVRCLEYAIRALRGGGDGSEKRERKRPFFILMPNYVANREYYREATADDDGNEARDIVYVVPSRPYEYDHPEGTGHDLAPFSSIWFCGIGEGNIERARVAFQKWHHESPASPSRGRRPPRLATSLAQLREMGAIDAGKRPNPRQRRKLKKTKATLSGDRSDAPWGGRGSLERSTAGDHTDAGARGSGRQGQGSPGGKAKRVVPAIASKRRKKKSKHRDDDGVRKRRRF